MCKIRKVSTLKITTQEEISALLGLVYYWGLYNLTNISTNILLSDTKGFPVFGAVMSRATDLNFYFQKLVSTILGDGQKDGKVIDSQLSESSLKNSMTIVQDILHQVNFYPLMRRYIPCVIKQLSIKIILTNLPNTAYYLNLCRFAISSLHSCFCWKTSR